MDSRKRMVSNGSSDSEKSEKVSDGSDKENGPGGENSGLQDFNKDSKTGLKEEEHEDEPYYPDWFFDVDNARIRFAQADDKAADELSECIKNYIVAFILVVAIVLAVLYIRIFIIGDVIPMRYC